MTTPNAGGVDQAVTASILEQAAPHPKAVFRSPAPTSDHQARQSTAHLMELIAIRCDPS
jgi:hypothetical protein